MTHPTPDSNGTISWMEAIQLIRNDDPKLDLYFLLYFGMDYGHMFGMRIDLGELEDWQDRLAVRAIADMLFPEA